MSAESPIVERKCKGCSEVKPLRKHHQYCDDCKPPEESKKGRKKSRATAPTLTSSWTRLAGFGFTAGLQVDDDKKQTDITIEQTTTEELGTQTIWLNQAEARELHSWLSSTLGL